MNKILVTGALGQIGSELTPELRDEYGKESVIGSDIEKSDEIGKPFEIIDVKDREKISEVVEEHNIDTIFHLASILSAAGENDPQLAYSVNVDGLYNVFEVGRKKNIDEIIVPSSIAAFGSETSDKPEEEAIQRPTTMYGISKVLTELMGNYYYNKYDLDIRGVRFPGILSYKTKPGGGTTDYAVEVFYKAIKKGEYTYFVRPDTKLPMMYMPDAVKALMNLAKADKSNLQYRCDYNVGALSFTPEELTNEIQKHMPDFEAKYEPDDRQEIADSWPEMLDDSAAREDWSWEPEYGLEELVEDMLKNLKRKIK